MPFFFHRDDRRVGVVIITGSCCIPGMAAFDEQARRVVEQAISETGIPAQVKVISAMTAYMGGVSRQVMGQIIAASQSGSMPLPAVLINGQPVSYGVPNVEDIKAALSRIEAETSQKEPTHE